VGNTPTPRRTRRPTGSAATLGSSDPAEELRRRIDRVEGDAWWPACAMPPGGMSQLTVKARSAAASTLQGACGDGGCDGDEDDV
jgi:hypothetical protein